MSADPYVGNRTLGLSTSNPAPFPLADLWRPPMFKIARMTGILRDVLRTSQDPDIMFLRNLVVRTAIAHVHAQLAERGSEEPLALLVRDFCRLALILDGQGDKAEFNELQAMVKRLGQGHEEEPITNANAEADPRFDELQQKLAVMSWVEDERRTNPNSKAMEVMLRFAEGYAKEGLEIEDPISGEQK